MRRFRPFEATYYQWAPYVNDSPISDRRDLVSRERHDRSGDVLPKRHMCGLREVDRPRDDEHANPERDAKTKKGLHCPILAVPVII